MTAIKSKNIRICRKTFNLEKNNGKERNLLSKKCDFLFPYPYLNYKNTILITRTLSQNFLQLSLFTHSPIKGYKINLIRVNTLKLKMLITRTFVNKRCRLFLLGLEPHTFLQTNKCEILAFLIFCQKPYIIV